MGRIDLWPGKRASSWASEQTVNVELGAHFYVNLPPRGPRPTFRCLRTTFLRRVLSCSLIAMCKPVSKTIFFDPQENEKKDVSATGVYSPQPHGLRVVQHAFFFFFHSPNLLNRRGWSTSLPSDCSNFESEKTSALCTPNFYDVQCSTVYACEAALAMGKRGEIIASLSHFPDFYTKQALKVWRSPLHAVFYWNVKGKTRKKRKNTASFVASLGAGVQPRSIVQFFMPVSGVEKPPFSQFFSRLWGVISEEKLFVTSNASF